jgi:hypothetical protein
MEESMLRKTKKTIIFFLIFSFMLFDFSIQTAKGEMIASETALALAKQENNRARISAFLNRQDVHTAMVQHGVNPEEAQKRVSGLSDEEVLKAARVMDQMPAGGDGVGAVVGAAVFIFVVLLITDLLGLTHVFPFINR